jgi:hypothetical protein
VKIMVAGDSLVPFLADVVTAPTPHGTFFGWALPERVELQGEAADAQLLAYFGEAPRVSGAREVRGALDKFLALAAGNHEKVRAFVEAHGIIRFHLVDPTEEDAAVWFSALGTSTLRPEVQSVAEYIFHARLVAALVRNVPRAALRQPIAQEDCDVLDEYAALAGREDFPPDARVKLSYLVNRWAHEILAMPFVVWENERPIVGWTGGLRAVLGLSLLATVGMHGGFTCTYCGRPIKRERTPRAGTRPTCSRKDCVKASQRDRVRRYRERPPPKPAQTRRKSPRRS